MSTSSAEQCEDRQHGKLPVAVEADEDPGQIRGAQLTFSCSRDTAFFRLRILLVPGDTYAYLMIPPEQITSLTCDQTSTSPEVAKACRSMRGTIRLRFTLRRSASLIGPGTWLKEQVDEQVLNFLRSLTTQTTFAIHVALESQLKPRLTDLCKALSSDQLRSDQHLADISKLYKGEGGKVMVMDNSALRAVGKNASPPSYDEHGASTPSGSLRPSTKRRPVGEDASPPSYEEHGASSPSGGSQPSTKRRRVGEDATPPGYDENGSSSPSGKLQSHLGGDEQEVGQTLALCHQLFHQELGKMERRITDTFTSQLEQLKSEIMDHIEERVSEVAEEVKAEATGDCNYYVDDVLTGIKIEMEDFVKEEMGNVEERIIDTMEGATWHGCFRRSDDQ